MAITLAHQRFIWPKYFEICIRWRASTHHILAEFVEVVEDLAGGVVEQRPCHGFVAELAGQLLLYAQADVFGSKLTHAAGSGVTPRLERTQREVRSEVRARRLEMRSEKLAPRGRMLMVCQGVSNQNN